MTTIVFYHANCPDGWTAAYAAWTKLKDTAKYVPVNYGDKPWKYLSTGDRVYILDFSFDRDTMIKMMKMTRVICLDHHKTAKEALLGLNCAIFDMNKSGAMLAWEYWHPNEPAPDLIRYVQDRDLWRKELPYTEEIYMGLLEQPQTFERWDELARMPYFVDEMRAIGQPLYLKKMSEVRVKADSANWYTIADYLVPVVDNCSRYYSDVCYELLIRYPQAKFSVAWRDDTVNNVRRWDFRSKGSFDVSAIAKQFGGGGHLNASGCQTPIGEFLPSI
jgi:oligoribonuclease NrnB/cAMP/cGMP phosphodiesterase (DHH superfamily)